MSSTNHAAAVLITDNSFLVLWGRAATLTSPTAPLTPNGQSSRSSRVGK